MFTESHYRLRKAKKHDHRCPLVEGGIYSGDVHVSALRFGFASPSSSGMIDYGVRGLYAPARDPKTGSYDSNSRTAWYEISREVVVYRHAMDKYALLNLAAWISDWRQLVMRGLRMLDERFSMHEARCEPGTNSRRAVETFVTPEFLRAHYKLRKGVRIPDETLALCHDMYGRYLLRKRTRNSTAHFRYAHLVPRSLNYLRIVAWVVSTRWKRLATPSWALESALGELSLFAKPHVCEKALDSAIDDRLFWRNDDRAMLSDSRAMGPQVSRELLRIIVTGQSDAPDSSSSSSHSSSSSSSSSQTQPTAKSRAKACSTPVLKLYADLLLCIEQGEMAGAMTCLGWLLCLNSDKSEWAAADVLAELNRRLLLVLDCRKSPLLICESKRKGVEALVKHGKGFPRLAAMYNHEMSMLLHGYNSLRRELPCAGALAVNMCADFVFKLVSKSRLKAGRTEYAFAHDIARRSSAESSGAKPEHERSPSTPAVDDDAPLFPDYPSLIPPSQWHVTRDAGVTREYRGMRGVADVCREPGERFNKDEDLPEREEQQAEDRDYETELACLLPGCFRDIRPLFEPIINCFVRWPYSDRERSKRRHFDKSDAEDARDARRRKDIGHYRRSILLAESDARISVCPDYATRLDVEQLCSFCWKDHAIASIEARQDERVLFLPDLRRALRETLGLKGKEFSVVERPARRARRKRKAARMVRVKQTKRTRQSAEGRESATHTGQQ